jgi:hypothetical protein
MMPMAMQTAVMMMSRLSFRASARSRFCSLREN